LLLKDIRRLQFINAGIDFVPLAELPAWVRVATNGGGLRRTNGGSCAGDGAGRGEAAVGGARGAGTQEFNQFVRNRMLAAVCAASGGSTGSASPRTAGAWDWHAGICDQPACSEEPTDWHRRRSSYR
jgi:hypothetical protein